MSQNGVPARKASNSHVGNPIANSAGASDHGNNMLHVTPRLNGGGGGLNLIGNKSKMHNNLLTSLQPPTPATLNSSFNNGEEYNNNARGNKQQI